MRDRLIATDIDGTLLNERKEVTPRARAAMAAFQRRGGMVVLSTARPPRATIPLYDDLGLSGPIIAYNGALIFDPVRKVPIVHHPLEKETALRVLREIRALDPNIKVGAELADAWYIDRIDERLCHLHAAGRIPELPVEGPVEHPVAVTTRWGSKLYFVVPVDMKAAAGAVTGPNTADGWAEAVERYALAG